jgi:lipase ATG15
MELADEEPDHTDKQTILNFAYLTLDSYFEPENKGWIPVPGWNVSSRFGWENTGIRGYLFEDDEQKNLIIAIKGCLLLKMKSHILALGTSLATPVGSGPTAKLDKLNDNMMFSCCCAKAGWSWTPICDCPKPNNECSMSCLLKESNFDGSYYNLAQV